VKSALWLALLLCGCGDPLADGAFRGEPLLRLRAVTQGQLPAQPVRAPTVGLLWLGRLEFGSPENPSLGLSSVATALTSSAPVKIDSFPASFDFELYDAPAAPLQPVPDGETRFAIARLAVLDDADLDGRFTLADGEPSAPDRLFGESILHLVVWVDRLAAAPQAAHLAERLFANPRILAPGFNLVTLSLLDCRAPPCGAPFKVIDPATEVQIVLMGE
jgi:hypothetical protein